MQKHLKFLQNNVKENRMWSEENKITTLWGNSQILLRNLTSTGGAIWGYWWKLFLQSIWFLVFVNHFAGFLCECYNWTTAHLVMRDFGSLILQKICLLNDKNNTITHLPTVSASKNSDSTKCRGFALLMESRVGTLVTLLLLLQHAFRIVAISVWFLRLWRFERWRGKHSSSPGRNEIRRLEAAERVQTKGPKKWHEKAIWNQHISSWV